MERKPLVAVLVVAITVSFLAGIYSGGFLQSDEKAEFVLENLEVTSPSPYGKIYNRTPITVSLDVSNRGNRSGVRRLSVKIDGEAVENHSLPFVAGESRTVKTEVEPSEKFHEVGDHTVEVEGLTATYRVEEIPVNISVGGLTRPPGNLYNCASGEPVQAYTPVLEVSTVNEGHENMLPFRVALETPEGAFSEGGVFAQTEDACTRSELQGETTHYVPLPVSPQPGEYKLKVTDYGVQGIRERKISFSDSVPEVVHWGPIQFERKGDGFIASRAELTVRNEGELPLPVAGLVVSVAGENLKGRVAEAPHVLPQEEKSLQVEFENHATMPKGTYAAEFKLLKLVKRGEKRGVVPVAEATREIEIG